jgi:hypothetical protein
MNALSPQEEHEVRLEALRNEREALQEEERGLLEELGGEDDPDLRADIEGALQPIRERLAAVLEELREFDGEPTE